MLIQRLSLAQERSVGRSFCRAAGANAIFSGVPQMGTCYSDSSKPVCCGYGPFWQYICYRSGLAGYCIIGRCVRSGIRGSYAWFSATVYCAGYYVIQWNIFDCRDEGRLLSISISIYEGAGCIAGIITDYDGHIEAVMR